MIKSNNVLPLVESNEWKTEDTELKVLALYDKTDDGLVITLDSKSYGVGKWIVNVPVSEKQTYKISVTAQTESVVHDVYAIINIIDEDNNILIREHLETVDKVKDGFSFTHIAQIPQNGCSVKLELWLKGYSGKVKWTNPQMIECDKIEERNVGVALAYIAPNCIKNPTIEKNVEMIIKAIDNAGKKNPDIIVLSEAMYERGVPNTNLKETSQSDTGEMCTLIREKAIEYNTYIIYNFHEVDNGEYYNTSILIDRKGDTVGKYRKTQLTVAEYDEGMTPGVDTPVFDTDFGKIGILICFDHYFPHTSETLAKKGAEIVFISSAGDAEEKLSARALDNGIYFAVCGWNTENTHGWGPARVAAPNGEIIAESSVNTEPAYCVIDLNKRVRRRWLSLGDADSQFNGVYKFEKNENIK